jgi:hypothetical protein
MELPANLTGAVTLRYGLVGAGYWVAALLRFDIFGMVS